MITEEQNIVLLTVGNSALKNPDWIDYGNYCFEREKGLRKEAFKHLENFIKSATIWSSELKIAFAEFLFPLIETAEYADHALLPQPLSKQLIESTLLKWCEIEKTDSRPFRWYGKYYHSEKHLLKALEINPSDDLARQVLLNKWADYLYYSIHHLPEGYIGNPGEDIELGEKMKVHIAQLTTEELRKSWLKTLEDDLKLVRNYIDWKESGHSDFEKWGQENNRLTGYEFSKAYYYEK